MDLGDDAWAGRWGRQKLAWLMQGEKGRFLIQSPLRVRSKISTQVSSSCRPT